MGPSIKKRIFDRLLENLNPLKEAGLFASITRELDPLKVLQTMPSLQIFDGPETEVSRDTYGRTYQFPLTLRILAESATDLSGKKDELVPEVQAILETDIQLNGLAIVVDGGEEDPILNELGAPIGGAHLNYTVQYRRKRGSPDVTY